MHLAKTSVAGSQEILNPATLSGKRVNTEVLHHVDPHADGTSCRRDVWLTPAKQNPPAERTLTPKRCLFDKVLPAGRLPNSFPRKSEERPPCGQSLAAPRAPTASRYRVGV